MLKLVIRVLLFALAFLFVLPHINGIQFHGNFMEAVGLGAAFAIMSWLVGRVAGWLTAMFAVGTLGLGLLILVPMWLFGFWLLPVFALKLVAAVLPTYLTVSGWGPAILGGLVMLVISMFTAERRQQSSNSASGSDSR